MFDQKHNTFRLCIYLLLVVFMTSCHHSRKLSGIAKNSEIKSQVKIKNNIPPVKIKTGDTRPEELVNFAETLLGTKYKYGGTDKESGFDCSGFMWYVFNHFGIKAPRVSEAYTNAGREVNIKESKKGDIILFTGSDAQSGKTGHIGLITDNQSNKITFIHSASGGGKGVMKSQMNTYFTERFIKVNRIFND